LESFPSAEGKKGRLYEKTITKKDTISYKKKGGGEGKKGFGGKMVPDCSLQKSGPMEDPS